MKNKLIDKIAKQTPNIIFGILSGAGLFFLIGAISSLITLIPLLKDYFLPLYIILHLVILIPTSIYYAKGWFRIFYLVSALILLLTYIYTKIFGVT